MLGKPFLISKRRVQVIYFSISPKERRRDKGRRIYLFDGGNYTYRRQSGLPIKVSMGVCIQRMIDAEAAGVMFTRHPTTGDPSNITITANYGLGEVYLITSQIQYRYTTSV